MNKKENESLRKLHKKFSKNKVRKHYWDLINGLTPFETLIKKQLATTPIEEEFFIDCLSYKVISVDVFVNLLNKGMSLSRYGEEILKTAITKKNIPKYVWAVCDANKRAARFL